MKKPIKSPKRTTIKDMVPKKDAKGGGSKSPGGVISPSGFNGTNHNETFVCDGC